LIYAATVPANSSATLYLPAKGIQQITESGKPISSWQGVRVEKDKVVIPLGSGMYNFEVKNWYI
jgi:alpha-L-rhamnosidase